jgi:hypothetical protein
MFIFGSHMFLAVLSNPIDQFLTVGMQYNFFSNYRLTVITGIFSFLIIFVTYLYSINYRSLFMLLKSFVSVSSGTLMPTTGYNAYMSVLFAVICAFNIFGLIPYSLTLTSLALTTLYFGVQSFLGLNVVAFAVQNSKLAGIFLPSGSPLAMS